MSTHDPKKPFCKVCKKQIVPAFLCVCGGAPGSESSDDAKSDLITDGKVNASATTATTSAVQNPALSNNDPHILTFATPALTPHTMMLIIADMLAKQLLTIEDNKILCTLIIKCEPKFLSEQQKLALKEFIKTIKNELDDFKAKHGLSDKDCLVRSETDNQGNIISLSINIPKPTLYAEFINLLTSKNLLPTAKNTLQDKQNVTNTPYKRCTPFDAIAKGPKPNGWIE
jgi:hypothetical protein